MIAPNISSSITNDNHNNSCSAAELVAVLIAVTRFSARVLTIDEGTLLPFGPLTPIHHSLQAGARAWVLQQTQQPLGYMEQLYTFVDVKRTDAYGLPTISISYLGLVREAEEQSLNMAAKWHDWYVYLPWEDARSDEAYTSLLNAILPQIQRWVDAAPNSSAHQARQQRMNLCWGLNDYVWHEENTLLRYELMYEVGLVPESPFYDAQLPASIVGRPMQHHHRRILATAVARLRAKLKYRPVLFDLMPPKFTLYQLQRSIEALNGIALHKQNFRRLVHNQDLVIPVGETITEKRGRPAQLYQFNQSVLQESFLSGYKLPVVSHH